MIAPTAPTAWATAIEAQALAPTAWMRMGITMAPAMVVISVDPKNPPSALPTTDRFDPSSFVVTGSTLHSSIEWNPSPLL
jgi:hypothetical protein